MNMKYILYARKSSESEDRQVQSIDDQIDRLKELGANLKLNIVEVLTEAKSAKRPDERAVFQTLLNKIEKGEADAILCWQINRLSRNPMDSGRLQMMLQDGVIKSIRTIDREYQPTDNVLLFSVESGMANQFILDLRKNTLRGLDSKVSKGWLPARAPVGYLNDVLNKTIIKDPDRFNTVRKMWDLMLTGSYNPTKIVEIANTEWGLRTLKRQRSGNKPLSESSIYRTLTNKFYAGIVCYKDMEYPGAHEPMISMNEFDRVQILLGRAGKPKPQVHEFAFTGIIKCGTCGCYVTAEEKTKFYKTTKKTSHYTYYRCTRRKRRDTECHEPAITKADLENQIEAEILKFTIDPDFRDFALSKLHRNNDNEIEARTQIRRSLEKTYCETQKQLDNLTKMRYRDLIDDALFIKESAHLRSVLAKTQQQLNESHDRSEKWLELTAQAFHFATDAYTAFKSGDLRVKREIFNTIGKNYVLRNGEIHIEQQEWLLPISNALEHINSDQKRLEPVKNGSVNKNTPASAEVYSRWGHIVEDVRTAIQVSPLSKATFIFK